MQKMRMDELDDLFKLANRLDERLTRMEETFGRMLSAHNENTANLMNFVNQINDEISELAQKLNGVDRAVKNLMRRENERHEMTDYLSIDYTDQRAS